MAKKPKNTKDVVNENPDALEADVVESLGGDSPADEVSAATAAPEVPDDAAETGPAIEAPVDDRADADAPAEPVAEPVAAAPAYAPVSEPVAAEPSSGGFGLFSVVLWGLAAAAIGFVAAFYVPRSYLPSWWPSVVSSGELDERLASQQSSFEELLTKQSENIQTLATKIDALAERPEPEAIDPAALTEQVSAALTEQVTTNVTASVGEEIRTLRDQIGTVATSVEELAARPPVEVTGDGAEVEAITALQDQITTLTERLTSVEDNPVAEELQALNTRLAAIEESPLSAEVAAETEAQLNALQASLEEQMNQNTALAEELQKIATEADDVANAATTRAAVSQIRSAIDRGVPFDSALNELAETGADVPEALAAVAAAGVQDLTSLQGAFPAAARAALTQATRASADGSATSRLGAFLRNQVNPRSLEPREGDDPDAILSRAEAALQGGDLRAALDEVRALPEAGQSAMADWISQATLRLDATAAAEALATSPSN